MTLSSSADAARVLERPRLAADPRPPSPSRGRAGSTSRPGRARPSPGRGRRLRRTARRPRRHVSRRPASRRRARRSRGAGSRAGTGGTPRRVPRREARATAPPTTALRARGVGLTAMPTMVTRIGVGVPDFAGQVVVFDSFDREDNNYFRMYGIRLRRAQAASHQPIAARPAVPAQRFSDRCRTVARLPVLREEWPRN